MRREEGKVPTSIQRQWRKALLPATVSTWNYSWFCSETKPITWGQWSRKNIILNWVLNSHEEEGYFIRPPSCCLSLCSILGRSFLLWDHISGLGFLWKQLALEQFKSKKQGLSLYRSHSFLVTWDMNSRLQGWKDGMRPDFSWSAVPSPSALPAPLGPDQSNSLSGHFTCTEDIISWTHLKLGLWPVEGVCLHWKRTSHQWHPQSKEGCSAALN